MNTIMFIAGLGTGCGFGGLLFLVVLGIVAKDLGKKSGAQEHAKVTEELLRERNAINGRIDSRLATLQEWALQNWKP